MKKTRIGIVCMATLSLLLTGCGEVLPDMTDEEMNTIGEYAAITLLKYDVNARSRLVDASVIEALENAPEPEVLPEPEPEPEPEKVPDVQDVPVVDNSVTGEMPVDSMESFLELPEGVTVSFMDYETGQSYHEEDDQYFALEASAGKELLILHFSMQNTSGAAQEINLLDRKDSYHVTVNESYTRTTLPTLLLNDLSTYKGTLAADGKEELVLLIELSPEELQNVSSVSLNLKNASKTCTIQLL